MTRESFRFLPVLLACTALSACGATDRIASIGKAPDMSPITNPQTAEGYKPVSLPMPREEADIKQNNSLWSMTRQTFFKDQRARKIGDILTVMIDINDEAQLKNETERKRTSSEGASLDALLGIEANLDNVLHDEVDNTNLVEGGADSSHKGTGKVDREEEIKMQMAAMIVQVLPNGNLVLQGRQEVRVNFEKRILELTGVIRPEDIDTNNHISYEKIAEARIAYGGKGQITDVQQPRYGQQLYDVVFPF